MTEKEKLILKSVDRHSRARNLGSICRRIRGQRFARPIKEFLRHDRPTFYREPGEEAR